LKLHRRRNIAGSWRARIGISLLSALLAICVAEIGLRIAGYGDVDPSFGMGTLGEDLLPVHRARASFTDPNTGIEYRINGDGFRGAEFRKPREPGVGRVAVVGDSFTLGWCVREEDTLPVRLQTALSRMRDRPVEVLNLGMGGTNTQQQHVVTQGWGIPLEPDVLVLVVNDSDTECANWSPDPVWTCQIPTSWKERAEWWSFHHLYLYRVARTNRRELDCLGPRTCYGLAPQGSVRRRCFEASVERVVEAARVSGIAPMVVFYPTPFPFWEPGTRCPTCDLEEALGELTQRLDVPYLDLSGLFEPMGGAALKVDVPGDLHPGPRAHEMAAEALAPLVHVAMGGQGSSASDE